MPPLSPVGEALRSVLRAFPASVAVLTVDSEGERVGLTIGSLVPLSLEPPLVGVGINRHAAMHEILRHAEAFALSLLAGDQTALAQHFARGVPPIRLWHGIAVRERSSRAPLLAGALGWLECRTWAEYDAGDHTLFVGEVLAAERGRAAPALVYVDRRYLPLPQ